jgi:SEC-C motif domain protein
MAFDAHGACPCGSGATYGACCGPLHRGEREAPDAATLMRSRFAAYAVGDAAYLWKTLHRDHDDRSRPEATVRGELREAFRRFRYMGLTVLDQAPADREGVAKVLFLARVFERGQDRSFVEVSDFLHDGVGWRYLCGSTLPVNVLLRDPRSLTIANFPAAR